MPNLDNTGPQGQGSQTGRGQGNCQQNNALGSQQQTTPQEGLSGRGRGQRCRIHGGRGRGCGRGGGRRNNR